MQGLLLDGGHNADRDGPGLPIDCDEAARNAVRSPVTKATSVEQRGSAGGMRVGKLGARVTENLPLSATFEVHACLEADHVQSLVRMRP